VGVDVDVLMTCVDDCVDRGVDYGDVDVLVC
jgi:hypothetical protein